MKIHKNSFMAPEARARLKIDGLLEQAGLRVCKVADA